MNKKNIILFWVGVIILFIVGFAIYNSNKTPDSAAYVLMSETLNKLGVKDIKLESDSIAWALGRYERIDGKMMVVYRDGYTFTTDSAVGDMSIVKGFIQTLVEAGFTEDLNNSSDAKWFSTAGFSKGSIGCIFRSQIDVEDPSQIVDGEIYPSISTISCIDNIIFENKNASSTVPISTTTSTTTSI